MALALDGTPTVGLAVGGTTCAAAALTAPTAGDIIVVVGHAEAVSSQTASPTVTSVTGGGLTFQQRGTTLTMHGGLGTSWNSLVVFWAYASAAVTSQVFTINWSGNVTIDDMSVNAYAVTGFTGTNYHTNPWDSNVSLPASAVSTATTSVSISGVSTTSPSPMTISSQGSPGGGGGPAIPAGFTSIAVELNGGGSNNSFLRTDYQLSTQSSATVTSGNTLTGWLIFVDALALAGTAPSSWTATPLSAGAPVFGTPALGIYSALNLGNNVLDFGLNRLHTNANFIYICSSVPTTYVQATTTYALGSASVAAGTLFGTMSNGSPAGRIVNSSVISAGAVTAAGTPVCWAVIDSVNSDLMASGPANGFSAVTSGQTWQLGSFDVHMSNT